MRPRFALVLVVATFGCPADDWHDDLDYTSEGGASMTSTTAASATATASASSTSVATTASTTDGTGSGTDTNGTATATDTTTGTGECAAGREPAETTTLDGCGSPVGEAFCSEGQDHVDEGTDIQWMHDPPHSGPHYPTPTSWGEHTEVVARGTWVHNLEHGGVVLSYRCNDDCDPEVAILRAVVEMRPDLRVLLTPDPQLPGTERFAAISWTWVFRFDTPDLATLLCFADQHEGHAPEDIPK